MTENKDVEVAKQTIDREIEALKAMENELDGDLTTVVDVLQKTKGRVIVTGMGKSGHIGRKIAATFASTGTPAFFLHPGEASHGDLGMITKDDTVIAVSQKNCPIFWYIAAVFACLWWPLQKIRKALWAKIAIIF